MTTVTESQLMAPAALPATDTAAVYTAPVNTVVKIGRAVFTNTSAGALSLTAGISTGGALAAGTTLISARTLAPGESYVSPELAGQVLPPGSAIRAFGSTSITGAISGILIQ